MRKPKQPAKKPPKSAKRSADNTAENDESSESRSPGVRPFWSGTITFGLVSIPVDLLSAVQSRQTALKMIDKEGHALGRQYHCSKEGKKLNHDDLIRGYETDDGKMVPISDEEFESVAPEMSSDIDLINFVPVEQIPPVYFQKSYFLAPAGKSSKSYNLLAATMARTGHAGIGSFVMRGHEYLVAIVSDNGVLRADTLRYADEIRTPSSIGLPKIAKAPAKLVSQFVKEIAELKRTDLNMTELEDKEAEALQALVKEKQKDSDNVIHQAELETDDDEPAEGGAQILDLMAVLRKSLSNRAVVTNAQGVNSERSAPISLDERRARKQASQGQTEASKKSTPKKKATKGKAQRRK